MSSACPRIREGSYALAVAQAPFKDRPEYVHAAKLAEDVADLLAPQSGAYYDVWLDGEKFVSSQMEVCPP